MTSHSFATLTKALGLGKSRKQSRPPMLRTSHSHSSLFSPNPDDLSGSPPPRSAPPTRSSLRHSKSTNNFLTLGRTWTRSRNQPRNHHHHHQRSRTVDDHHHHNININVNSISSAATPTTPNPTGHPSTFTTSTLERRSTSSTASSSHTAYTAYTRTVNDYSLALSPLPAEIWPRFVWDPSVDPEDIDLGFDDEEDDYDNQPVFADFFQRLRAIEAELDLIEARGGVRN